MIQHLLNATCIWLLSLVIFDLLLRRETFHNYNRAYLLFTFLLGLILPFWKWKSNAAIAYSPSLVAPVRQAGSIRQALVQNAATTVTPGVVTHHASFSWLVIVWVVYFCGVCISVFLLIVEVWKLIKLFRKGERAVVGDWIIIETHQSHAPCSFLHYIFVSNKQQYDAAQWDAIIRHEQRHGKLLHVTDVLLMQLARIVLWFHPLVYLYEKRLLLVHEYQADKALGNQLQSYGQFLVEQAMLQNGSALSHSLTRSSIKSRIMMLTKRSSRLKSIKLIVVVPLLLCCIVCFTQNAFSNTKKIAGSKIFYNGNVFESSLADTAIVFNGDTASAQGQMKHFPVIIKMNEQPVYSYYPVFTYRADKDADPAHAVVTKNTYRLYQYLLDSTMSLLTQLGDGFYCLGIYNPVIDENGKLVYYEDEPFQWTVYDTLCSQVRMPQLGKDDEYGILLGAPRFWWKKDMSKWKNLKIDPSLKEAIDKRMYALLENMPVMERVYKNGKAVPYLLERGTKYGGFDIKNHHFTIIPVTSANY